jgi:UPF0716 protein FxsA
VALLALLFIGVPILELYVIIRVGQWLGALETIGLLILISVVGAWLAKREGLGVWRRIQAQVDAGRVPGAELLDAFLILLAGALLLTPGFLTDVLAIVLLIPPTRALVRRVLRRRFASRVQVFRAGGAPSPPPDIDV